MIAELQLITGVDIPFQPAQIVIHQPRIREIAYLGELNFLQGCELIKFSKEDLDNIQGKDSLNNYSNFEILMETFNQKEAIKSKNLFIDTLQIFLPLYEIKLQNKQIVLTDNNGQLYYLNNSNYEDFKLYIDDIVKLDGSSSKKYNPSGQLAAELARKFKNREKQKNKMKKTKNNRESIFSTYISILAVGEQRDINSFLNYTTYQLKEQFDRFILKYKHDYYIQRALAGALPKNNKEEVEDWMKFLHDNK